MHLTTQAKNYERKIYIIEGRNMDSSTKIVGDFTIPFSITARKAIIKKLKRKKKKISVGEDLEKLEFSYIAVRNVK